MKQKLRRYKHYFSAIACLFLFAVIILCGQGKESINTSNVNTVKSIAAVHIVEKYNALKESAGTKEVPLYDTFEEAITNAKEGPVAFVGKLTAYGPDCVGCGGGSACPPRQDFRNGNIYFEDQTYGTVRVLAADKRIPCGSIIRVSNIRIYKESILAIVMDRGGAIQNNHLDLLFTTESNLEGFSTQNDIKFEILRYGW